MWQLLVRDFDSDYYVKIDDDTLLVAPDTLRRVLQRTKPAYWGACATQYRAKCTGGARGLSSMYCRGRVSRILRFVYHTEEEAVLYAQGGLYALSRVTAEAVAAALPRTAELFQAGARSHRSGRRIDTEEDSLVGLAVRLLGHAVTCTTRVHGVAMSDDTRGPCRATCRSQVPLRSLNPTCVQSRYDVAIHPVKAGIPPLCSDGGSEESGFDTLLWEHRRLSDAFEMAVWLKKNVSRAAAVFDEDLAGTHQRLLTFDASEAGEYLRRRFREARNQG
jgi:hypothetical protein